MHIRELDARIRELRAQTSGVEGAVLREADPEGYARKQVELAAAMRDYYHAFYGDRVSMP